MNSLIVIKDNLKFGFNLLLCTVAIFFFTFVTYITATMIFDDMNLLSWGYFILASLGHAFLFSVALYTIGYVPFAILFRKRKIASTIFIVLGILLQIFFIIDIFVFEIYKFHINGFVVELILGGAATDIFVFDWWLYIRIGAILILFAVAPFILGYIISRMYYRKIKPVLIKSTCIFFILCIIISHLGYAVAHAAKDMGIQKSATVLPAFFPLTANSLLTKWGILKTDDLDNVSYNTPSSDIQYPINPIIATDSIPDYNIIYIVVDSWNPSVLDPDVSPNIAAFLPKAQYFTSHMSSSRGTRGSLFSIFFGLSFTYENEFYISKMTPLFVDRLLLSDYDIETFPSADFTNPPFHDIIFRNVPGIRVRAKGETPMERDEDITKEFIDFIDKRESKKPFFSFMFYDLPHGMTLPEDYHHFKPSWDAPDYINLKNDMDRTPFFNLYRNCIYKTDILIGKVLAEIQEKGLLENSIIVITGDHGQEFNENKKNYWGHGSNFSKWQIQVPFIIYHPGIEGGRVFNHATSHYDISPTILHRFMGIKNPSSDYSMGFDLWNNADRFPHVVGDHINYGFVMHDLIITTNHTGTMDITDLEMNDAPRDRINIKELQQAIAKKNMFYRK